MTEEIKDLQQAWKEDNDASDAFLAKYYSGTGKEDEIRSLNEEQIIRLAELYCGPVEDMDDDAWLRKAASSGNPYAKKLLPSGSEMPEEKKEEKPKKKKTGLLIGAVLLFLIAAGLCGYYAYYRYTTDIVEIDPVPYMSWEVSGLDTFGTATASIDAPAMSADAGRIVDGEVISLIISKDQNLSNGETVTLEIAVNEEAAERNHVAFTRTSTEFTVEGLKEIEKIDVFDSLSIRFAGENGKGIVTIVNDSEDPFLREVRYLCEPSENLSNGDAVHIRAIITPEMIEKYGKTAETSEMEVTAESLSIYPLRIEEFSESAFTQLYEKGLESLASTVFSDNARYSSAADPEGTDLLSGMYLENVTLSDVYLITPRDNSGPSQFHNRMILIMHVTSGDDSAVKREFCCPLIYQNILVNEEGILSLEDLSESSQVWLHSGKSREDVYKDAVSGYLQTCQTEGKSLESFVH